MPTKTRATKEARGKKKILRPGRGHYFKKVGKKILLMRQGGPEGGLGVSISCGA
jgi:hypothetical protein